MSLPRRMAVVPVVAIAALVLSMSSAFASHFRASNTTLSYDASSHVLTWKLNSAWRKGADDTLVYGASSVQVTSAGRPVPGVTVGDPVRTSDTSNPLYDTTYSTVTMDIGSTLSTPGDYQAYVMNCCRVAGVQNTDSNDSFSQAVSWTVNSDGSVDLPPSLDNPVLYALLPIASGQSFSVDYSASDPEGAAVTYTQVTNAAAPDYGATALPCSSFTGGRLTVSAALCAAGQTYSDIFVPGDYFAVKVRAADPAGNHSEIDTLLRVPTIPVTSVGSVSVDKGTATVTVLAPDTVVDDYSVQCTNGADSSDVVTGHSTSSPVSVTGLRPSATYSCVASATNVLGTGSSPAFPVTTPQFSQQSIDFPQPADAHLADATRQLTATADSGLAVAFSSSTPDVCTVSGATATLHTVGTCTITGDQPGDATYSAAPSVTQSFTVLPAAPTTTTLSSTGHGSDPQTVNVPVPTGGSITLLDGNGHPATRVAVAGQGVYSLDPATGVITFAPTQGFSGRATAVRFQVSDAYGQAAAGTFTASVEAAAGHARVTAAKLTRNAVAVPTVCSLSTGTINACTVRAYATLHGKRALIGSGTRSLTGAGASHGAPALTVRVQLTGLGRSLARRPGGIVALLHASMRPAAGGALRAADTHTRAVAAAVTVRSVYFPFDSAGLTAQARARLVQLRRSLGPVAALSCAGHTDYAGRDGHEKSLSVQRAKSVCAVLLGSRHGVHVRAIGYGGKHPVTTSGTPRSRWQNRRTDITLKY